MSNLGRAARAELAGARGRMVSREAGRSAGVCSRTERAGGGRALLCSLETAQVAVESGALASRVDERRRAGTHCWCGGRGAAVARLLCLLADDQKCKRARAGKGKSVRESGGSGVLPARRRSPLPAEQNEAPSPRRSRTHTTTTTTHDTTTTQPPAAARCCSAAHALHDAPLTTLSCARLSRSSSHTCTTMRFRDLPASALPGPEGAQLSQYLQMTYGSGAWYP